MYNEWTVLSQPECNHLLNLMHGQSVYTSYGISKKTDVLFVDICSITGESDEYSC